MSSAKANGNCVPYQLHWNGGIIIYQWHHDYVHIDVVKSSIWYINAVCSNFIMSLNFCLLASQTFLRSLYSIVSFFIPSHIYFSFNCLPATLPLWYNKLCIDSNGISQHVHVSCSTFKRFICKVGDWLIKSFSSLSFKNWRILTELLVFLSCLFAIVD